MIRLEDIVGRAVPFDVRCGKQKPITVVGFGSAGLAPLCSGVEDTTAVFKRGGWLWLPDLLRHYDLVEPASGRMVVKPLTEIGARKPVCVETVRVAAGLVTRTAQWRAAEAKRRGLPVDQCGKRGDFTVDGRVLCRAHAGAAALAHIIQEEKTNG